MSHQNSLSERVFPSDVFKPLQDVSLLDRKRQMTPDEYGKFLRSKGDIFFWPKGGFFVVNSF